MSDQQEIQRNKKLKGRLMLWEPLILIPFLLTNTRIINHSSAWYTHPEYLAGLKGISLGMWFPFPTKEELLTLVASILIITATSICFAVLAYRAFKAKAYFQGSVRVFVLIYLFMIPVAQMFITQTGKPEDFNKAGAHLYGFRERMEISLDLDRVREWANGITSYPAFGQEGSEIPDWLHAQIKPYHNFDCYVEEVDGFIWIMVSGNAHHHGGFGLLILIDETQDPKKIKFPFGRALPLKNGIYVTNSG